MIENINSGHFALIVVGIIFLALQIWWIGMTIRNGLSKEILTKEEDTEKMKKRLEKIFLEK